MADIKFFFNELSLKIAKSDDEAIGWLTEFMELIISAKKILQIINENYSLEVRYNKSFSTFLFYAGKMFGDIYADLIESNAMYAQYISQVFLHTDRAHITDNEPKADEYSYTAILIDKIEYNPSGITAAFLNDGLLVSLNTDTKWDSCKIQATKKYLEDSEEQITVKHASQIKHLIECHLPFFSQYYDWKNYPPALPAYKKGQNSNLLPLRKLAALQFMDYSGYSTIDWNLDDSQLIKLWEDNFYRNFASYADSKAEILNQATKIADIHQLHPASNSVKNKNPDYTLYIAPDKGKKRSISLYFSIDFEKGRFEVCENKKKPNHLMEIDFNGEMTGEPQSDHSITI